MISEIFYNSPGSDNRSNASLNAEWVKLRNRTAHPVSLSGWTLRDTSHHVYHFAVGYSLRAHGTVRVHTGSGRDTQRNLFQDRRWYVWNNDGDTATLRGPAGERPATAAPTPTPARTSPRSTAEPGGQSRRSRQNDSADSADSGRGPGPARPAPRLRASARPGPWPPG